MAECRKCIHNAVCKTAESCDGYVSGCEHFKEGWISVNERLPDGFGTFLVAIDEVHGENRISVDAADFDPFEKRWLTFNYFCTGSKVTQWMPLPKPPKGE